MDASAWFATEAALASSVGLTQSQLKFVLAFFASFPLSALVNAFPTTTGMYAISLLSSYRFYLSSLPFMIARAVGSGEEVGDIIVVCAGDDEEKEEDADILIGGKELRPRRRRLWCSGSCK
jgi:hypothetical protein